MDLKFLAMRVAGFAPTGEVQPPARKATLNGPFTPVSPRNAPEERAEVDLTFGLDGSIIELIARSIPLDEEETASLVNASPADPFRIEVGYDVVHSRFSPGRRSGDPMQPDDPEEFDFDVVIRSIEGFMISPQDSKVLDDMGLGDSLKKEVEDYHYDRAREEPEPDSFDYQ